MINNLSWRFVADLFAGQRPKCSKNFLNICFLTLCFKICGKMKTPYPEIDDGNFKTTLCIMKFVLLKSSCKAFQGYVSCRH